MSSQRRTGGGVAVASVVTFISIVVVIVGFFFLPWVSFPAYDVSYTAWNVANDVGGEDADDVDIFQPEQWEDRAETYPTTVEPLTVDYSFSSDRVGEVTGSLIVPTHAAPRAGNSLFVILMLLVLLLLFAILEVSRRSVKHETLSYAAWISIIGIYGALFLVFHFGTHVNQDALVQNELARQMILAEGGMSAFGFTTASAAAAESNLQQVSSIVAAREAILEQTVFTDNYRSAFGSIGSGFWLMAGAMIAMGIQILIPRDLSRMSSFSGSDGARVASSIVVSDRTIVRDIWWRQVVISLAIIFALFPILFILSSAFNPTGTLSTQGLIPRSVESPSDLLVNFRGLMVDELDIYPFWNWLFNSFVVATTTTILVVLITALSAYSFSRFRFTGRRQLLLGILLIQVFPNLLAMVALFLILFQIGELAQAIPNALPFLSFIDWSWLNLLGLNSLGGLILVYMAGAMGINTWLMKGFFDSIPRDIDESALVDGASHWQIFWLLIFPLVRPILAVVGVLAFVGTFNEFVLARILLRDTERWTLMVGLYNFITADFNRDWGKFAAGALVSAVPVVVIYLALQDQIVGGLTAGSVKG